MSENEHHNRPKRDSVIRRGDTVRYKGDDYVGIPSGKNIFLYPLGTQIDGVATSARGWAYNPYLHSVEKVSSAPTTPPPATKTAPAPADLSKLSVDDEQLKFERACHFQYPDQSAPGCAEFLQCRCCKSPAYEPVTCTACHNMFCGACVADEPACPKCTASPLSTEIVRSLPILEPLNKLEVDCPKCNKRTPRHELQDHTQLHCPKVRVRCVAAGSLCAWKGPREALADHLPQCHHRAIAPQFEALTTKLADVCDKLSQVENHCTKLADALAKLEGEHNDLRMSLPPAQASPIAQE